ncbi:LCP family protein [Paenibacillus sp. ACRRX]|uniref:LCP family protein n=1 Tax=unclassified Paenibacillus TaxID=185978 RepID=UPI0031BB0E66
MDSIISGEEVEQVEKMEKRKKKKGKNTARKWWIILGVVLILGLSGFIFRKQLAIFAFDVFLSGSVEDKLSDSYKPIKGKPEVNREITEPFSALLLGVDQRDHEIGRSDTIIFSVVRPKDNKVLLVSIPRDTYTEIIGHGSSDKINHAFAFGSANKEIGGPKMSMDTVGNLLDHEINHYATINFEGLKDVVDAVGGVKLPIKEDIVNKAAEHEKFRIEANKPIYSGQEALYFVRYREDSDMNRTERHRIFLKAIMDRAIEMDQITKIPSLMDIMGKNFTTDMRPRYMIDLAKQMFQMDGAPTINSYMLHGEGKRIDGVWYYLPNEEDLTYIKSLITNWMDPKTESAQLMIPRKMKEE